MLKLLVPIAICSANIALADPPVIEDARAQKGSDGWRFDVTLSHGDTGWEDYADGWRVLSMDGAELGLRVLYHPHVNEQPFTRSLGGVDIPEGTTEIQIQARDIVGGWGGELFTVTLP